MRNIALLIEYDGTAYSGWQIQRNSNSIQAVIETALSQLLQGKARLIGAGRTDAGVHACGQTANFHTIGNWSVARLAFALNSILPRDIAITDAADVPENFHSRYDAISRIYSYTIIRRKSPMLREFAALLPYDLSIDKMNEAAEYLVGQRSFAAFSKNAKQQRNFNCKVLKATWMAETGNRAQVPGILHHASGIRFEIEANRFLHGMVRAIVGTLVDVGRGKLSIEAFRRIAESGDRSTASMSAPAGGLCLEQVKYGFNLWGNN